MSAGEFLSLEEGKMGETLVERDGWLYVLYQYPVYEKPEMVNIYWPLKIRAQQFISNYGNEYIGRELRDLREGKYEMPRINTLAPITFRLPDGGKTVAEFTETKPIPEPKQRGKKLEVRWRYGKWEKNTARGWRAA
jgi:hypothetical protein